MRRLLLLVLIAAGCRVVGERPAAGRPYDLLLADGWIVDGSGNPRFHGDLAISGDRIAAVGHLPGATARETLDVSGLIVAPGFIDMLGQSETRVLIDNRVLSKITQGVTTEVTGEGGSAAPLTDALVAEDSAYLKRYHLDVDWRDLDGYFAHLERTGTTINIATFVGATQVRRVVIGDVDRAPTPDELARMTALVDTMMLQGALGLSSSLIYAPAIYASTEELVALAAAAGRRGGIYATHMRNEGDRIDEALNETFHIARAANVPVEIWHLKVAGRTNWGRMPHVLARLDSARNAGLDVTADQYPYVASATSLDAIIPAWAHDGGTDSLLARLGRRATRAAVRDSILRGAGRGENMYRGVGGGDGVLIASVFADSLRYLQGQRLSEIARARGPRPARNRVRPPPRRSRAHGGDLLLHERARRGGRARHVVGGGEHGLRRRRPGRAVRHRAAPPPHLWSVHPDSGPLRARPSPAAARAGRAQNDVARRPTRRARQPRHAAPGHVRRHHGLRSPHRGRPRHVRRPAPTIGRRHPCVRERPGGTEGRRPHGRASRARTPRARLHSPGPAGRVTLGRLGLAWLFVAVWFVVTGWAAWRALGVLPADSLARRRTAVWTAGEATVVTLFASLWFNSLGSGGWWLLFLLVGLLAAFPVRLQGMVAGTLPQRLGLRLALVDTARYLGAGAILAWRL